MRKRRIAAGVFVWGPIVAMLIGGAQAQERPPNLPEDALSLWLCPNHQDQQGVGPAACPIDGVAFEKRYVVGTYLCPMHAHIEGESGHTCPICNMNLAPTTLELEWFCEADPDATFHEPGECADGSAINMKTVAMAHGDHNAKHGGILFMAPDGFHHLEGTLGVDGVFRLYLYNDFTRPIDASPFDADVEGLKLTPAENGEYLETRLESPTGTQIDVVAQVRFPDGDGEAHRFDFIFPESMLVGNDRPASEPVERVAALPEFIIPKAPKAIVAEIVERDKRIQSLISKGLWPDLYIPALEAKELMLALNNTASEKVRVPAKRMIRAAWLLDVYGDMGNRLEVERSYAMFARAIEELEAVYAAE